MNPRTGELVRSMAGQADDMVPLKAAALRREAVHELGDRDRAVVDLQGRTPLAAWAKKKRKAKLAATSRRRNRK